LAERLRGCHADLKDNEGVLRGDPRMKVSSLLMLPATAMGRPLETRLADGSAARSAHVRTMIWASRAALGAGGLNGTDRVIHKRDEEPHRAEP
jgi:hypothetical protein